MTGSIEIKEMVEILTNLYQMEGVEKVNIGNIFTLTLSQIGFGS